MVETVRLRHLHRKELIGSWMRKDLCDYATADIYFFFSEERQSVCVCHYPSVRECLWADATEEVSGDDLTTKQDSTEEKRYEQSLCTWLLPYDSSQRMITYLDLHTLLQIERQTLKCRSCCVSKHPRELTPLTLRSIHPLPGCFADVLWVMPLIPAWKERGRWTIV